MSPKLKNTVECYESAMTPETKAQVDKEIESWIAKGWLKPHEGDAGDGIIPLMAVVQANKDKVRPVMYIRELNEFVGCHPVTDATICDEAIRRWRCMREPLKVLDLKSVYLQIHIDSSLWPFQQLYYRGKLYCLTRLGFGLSSAPKIMTRILKEVLAKDERVCINTDSYIDIIVREEAITVEEVAAHLRQYGLESKPPEGLEDGRVTCWSFLFIGMPIVNSYLVMVTSFLTLKSWRACHIVSCFPFVANWWAIIICGWLRVACSFAKKRVRESFGMNMSVDGQRVLSKIFCVD